MVLCSYCCRVLDADARYCPHCGTPTPWSDAETIPVPPANPRSSWKLTHATQFLLQDWTFRQIMVIIVLLGLIIMIGLNLGFLLK